mgnify:CR=1 FL=1
MPAAQPASYNPNSLWRNGSRAFFSRAYIDWRVLFIMTLAATGTVSLALAPEGRATALYSATTSGGPPTTSRSCRSLTLRSVPSFAEDAVRTA